MHPVAQSYLKMDPADQKKVQLLLCERAREVWEALVPPNLKYHESVAGSEQVFDVQLPRRVLHAVLSGRDDRDLDLSYREPLAALQDDDIALPKRAEFAYYSIRNLFVEHILHRPTDPWLIINQALAAIGEDRAVPAFEQAVRSAGHL